MLQIIKMDGKLFRRSRGGRTCLYSRHPAELKLKNPKASCEKLPVSECVSGVVREPGGVNRDRWLALRPELRDWSNYYHGIFWHGRSS